MMPRALRTAAVTALLAAVSAQAYDPTGGTWANGDIVLHLQLGRPTAPLLDGAADWNAVAASAMDEWNAHLGRSRLVPAADSTAEVRNGNRINNIVLRADVFGTAFDSRTLAVTVGFTNRATARFSEQDVVFNANLAWSSYRGPLRAGTRDLRRVALHEFGHVLGLDHPDEATPPQTVSAIMNSTVGNLEALSADDIAGARALYTTGGSGPLPTLPVIVAQPQSRTVPVGGTYTFSVTATGSGPFTYAWFFRADGAPFTESLPYATGASYTLGSVQRIDAGTYTAYVRGPGGLTLSNAARLTVTAGPATTPATQLANLSTRGRVEGGTGVLIAGLAVTGAAPKSVLVRAAGPALAGVGVADALAAPRLRVVAADARTVAENEAWEAAGAGPTVAAAAQRLGAFPFAAGSRDAALLLTLAPGTYTAVVAGGEARGGTALVEVYDAEPATTGRRLVNIATRGRVDGETEVLIAGLVITGPGPRTYLIRGVGPTLLRAPFNLAEALRDPQLELYRGETLLRENDDWDTPANGMVALRAAAAATGAFALVETRDNVLRTGLDGAMLVTLAPGEYTAKLSGFRGDAGIGLIEVYELP